MSATARRLTKAIASELLPSKGAREVVARISTTAVDRDGDVILPSGAARRGPNSCTTRRRSQKPDHPVVAVWVFDPFKAVLWIT